MIFIDTGAFIARYVERDQYHNPALALWQKLAQRREACTTSNFVLDEALTLLGRIAGNRFAAERAHALYDSPSLRILRPDEAIEREAIVLFAKYADQGVSFTDCTSFALMQQNRIRRAFTFDEHFQRAGFSVAPSAK